ncbi:hypothetical protein FRB96_000800 [Tulasnella sp. 330]|nr:hypothetical protein FRB96_000800 [Tulasnella sp. 330]KAG8882511.1 hypothetical protein FRB97_008137 [Tulasnella sp. 331]
METQPPPPLPRVPWARLHDYCRVKKISLGLSQVESGPKSGPDWVSTVTLYKDTPEARNFTGGPANTKKASKNLAAEEALRFLEEQPVPAA